MALEEGGGGRKPRPTPPDDIYERRTPKLPIPTPGAEKEQPPASPPRPRAGGGWCGSDEWVQAFVKAHGRAPTGRDLKDCLWSEEFARKHGRPPTEEEWREHYYRGAATEGGRGGEEEEEELWPKAGELLGQLQFPRAEEVPPFLREWMRYFQDLLAQNPERSIPLPFRPLEEGEEETDFYQTLRETAKLLGLEHLFEQKEDFDPVSAFTDFINAVTKAPLPAQQALLGLRYTPEAGWHQVQTPMLPHPEYL